MCGRQWSILPTLPLSFSEKENRQAQGRIRKSKRDLNVYTLVILRHHTFSNYPPCPIKVISMGRTAAWTVCSTYHPVLKASPGAAIFGRDMLFDISLIAN
jgi:hypothetical protein